MDQLDDQNRLRVAKACTRCRTRKDRCDGLKPSCTNCSTSNQPCIYEATTKKRGLPEGYVRGLEKLLTLCSQSVDGLEDVLLLCLQDEDVKRNWNTAVGDELYSSWKESKIYQELETFLQSNGASAGSKRKRVTETNQNQDDEAGNSPDSWDSVLDHLRQQAKLIVGGSNINQQLTSLNPLLSPVREATTLQDSFPDNSKTLLDGYFSYVHCWFPILNRPTTLKAYHQHLRQSAVQKSDGSQALLWAMFAYTSMIIKSDLSDQNLSKQYAEIALKHIPAPSRNEEDVFDFSIGHAQALLILALLRLGNGQWLGSWNSTGRATRILLALRHQAQLQQAEGYARGQHESENEIRAALQGSFIIETLLNVHFQNAHSLFDVSLLQVMIEEDGHDEWNSWTAIGSHGGSEPAMILSIFNRLTRIFLILADVLAAPNESTDPVYIQSQLEKIHHLAQEHFANGIGGPSQNSPPHHVFFQIGLLFAQLRLVSCVPEHLRIHFELIPLSNNVLGLFDICSRASHIGLHHVPPLYADILVLASEVAVQAHNANTTSSSPIYISFTSTMLNFRMKLADVWGSFRRPEVRQNSSQYVTPEMPSLQRTMSASMPMAVWGTSNGSISGPSVNTNFGDPRHSIPNIYGFSMPGTSPSFSQGDEVDVIFHEMAHLDTNEWGRDRALGLREFGFTDESAFLEFCNDPQRLAVGVDDLDQGPLSSARQTWTFTGMNSNM